MLSNPARTIAQRAVAIALVLTGAGLWRGSRVQGLAGPVATDTITLSIVATTDVHGFVFPREDRSGGVALFGGYFNNLRETRARDGGVLLLDSGDTFQGGIESDLTEGALVVDAYNALGYAAATIGNHEFEFGPIDLPGARQKLGADPRGALKARAAQARFPFLAANLIDEATGRPVDWPNVQPSTLTTVAGVHVGVVGVTTIDALRATLPVNVHGLRVAPLAATIVREGRKLREAGAEVVVVIAHAGGSCWSFADPRDLSACDQSAEIVQVAKALPAGLVDVIAAGHTHDGVAHIVNGVAIVQAYALGRSFARVDLSVDRASRAVTDLRLFAPRELCARQDPETFRCDAFGRQAARYKGSR